jgi:hypothetical protein
MKGTFFSADFVSDSSNNLRLLELNTDTAISENNLVHLDYSGLISVLQSNNITKLTVIHKPNLHKALVADIKTHINENASFITEFTEVKESHNTIYPTSVTDADDLFILRIAYDESALFDSNYTKGTLNTLNLFANNNSGSLVTEYYHSSSTDGVKDNLSRNFNTSSLPDFVVKDISDATHTYLKFYKIGSESSDDTDTSRWNSAISAISTETNLIQTFHHNPDTITNNKVSSIRSYFILHGTNLDLTEVGQFKQNSPFVLPTLDLYDETAYVNKIDSKHYYEFATNIPKLSSTLDGILGSHIIVKADGSGEQLTDLIIGDELKSYYINGVDVSSDDNEYVNWSISGSALPSGSYVTSSAVIYKNSRDLEDKVLTKLNVEGSPDELYVATNKSFLAYDSGSNITSWKIALDLEPNNHYLLDYDGSTAKVTANSTIIINEDTFDLVEIDVEETDTFIISGSTSINSYVVHNAPCFIAGTEITLGSGDLKNIENVIEGDEVLTFNFDNDTIETNNVNNVYSKKVDKTVKYVFDNGTELQSTVDHPIYVIGKGWSSFENETSNKLYDIGGVSKIEIGDEVKLNDTSTKVVSTELIEAEEVVYNLRDIENNHNFFANGALVHNRKW